MRCDSWWSKTKSGSPILSAAGWREPVTPSMRPMDGAAAQANIHAADYDLVILDLMLPDMDGLKLLEKIRNRKVGPPVLILSARGGLDDRVKGLEQGAGRLFGQTLSPSSNYWRGCGRFPPRPAHSREVAGGRTLGRLHPPPRGSSR